MANTIVVGYDGSGAAKAALAEAVDMAKSMRDAQVVIACGHDRTPGYLGYDDQPLWKEAIRLDEVWEHMEIKIQEDLEEAAKTVREAGVKASTACSRGRPANVVINIARDADARMIVVGTRGSGKSEETTVLGSTTTELLHTAHIPVLVVPH
jgi:nucleotide-binding universal stress UspA family protein